MELLASQKCHADIDSRFSSPFIPKSAVVHNVWMKQLQLDVTVLSMSVTMVAMLVQHERKLGIKRILRQWKETSENSRTANYLYLGISLKLNIFMNFWDNTRKFLHIVPLVHCFFKAGVCNFDGLKIQISKINVWESH